MYWGLPSLSPEPLRFAHLGRHEASYGFLPATPQTTSKFVTFPIMVRNEIYGDLYLTDKVGWSEFTREDEALVGALAVAAGSSN